MSDASNGTQTPSLSASTSIPAPLESPFDFKEYEKQFANKKLQESLGELAFPDDDIEVKIEPRVNRTTKSSVPANASNLSDTYLKYCQEYFEQDWVSVDLTKTVSPVPKNVKVPDQEYEVDVVGRTVDKEAAKAEKDETSVLRVATKEQLLDERKKDRMPLFTTFHMNKPDTHYSLQKGRPFDTKFATQLLFEAKELKFQLGEIEPFFCTLALYDLKSKKKLTEDFQFDVNTANTSALIQHVLKEVEPATSARSCIFNYSGAKSEDVFLVLFVNKVLKGGSPDDHVDAYCKPQMKDKDKQKFVSETRGNLPRLAEYKQNFAWSAQPLFDARGALTIVGDAVFSDIVKCKGDLFDYLEDIKLNKTKKKRDSIPGEFTFALKLLDKLAEPPNRLTPSLLPVKPFNEAKDMKTIREIQELPYETPTAYPHCNYVNNLYFYPERVDLNNLKASGVSARNIGMEVKLLENDDNPNAEGLKVIYGDSTTAGLVSKAMSVVGYHNKKPKFFDEIKLQLPFQLTNKHHLLLTFYHVDCKPAGKKSKPGDSPLSAPLAYTFIPLLKDGQFLNEEKYSFPVALKLPTNYLSTPEDDILWMDNQKLLMTFSTKLVSSVYTLDPHLNNFLKLSLDPKQDQDKIVAGLEGLASADKKELVKFFPVITRGLLELIANFPPRISVLSFSTLLALADAVATNSNPDDNVLESFLSYIFDPNPKSNIGDHLLNNWLLAIQNKHVCLKDSLKFAWFLYGLIIKSMVLQLHHEKKLTDNNRTSRFAQSVHDQLMRAVLGFRTLTITFALDPAGSVPLSKLFNITTAHFITDLFAFMDRGFVFELIYNYVQELDPNNESMELTEMKFTFLRALTDYAHYLALNLPLHPKIQTVADIPYRFASKHFLSGLILMQLETTFVATNSLNRAKKMNMAINTLCDAIYKHDHDARYQANLARQRIASIYFPFILTAIDHYDLIAKLPAVSDEKRKLLACFYFVLKGADVELLKDYWERETEKRVFLFLDLMIMATDLFEYHGEHSVRATVAAEEMGLARSLDLSSTASSVDLSSGDAFADVASRMTSKKMKTVRKKYGKKTKPALVLDKKPSVMIVNQFMERTTVRDRKQTVNFDVEAKREANFAREISLVSLEVVLHLVASFSVALKNLSMFDKIFGVLINLLRKNQSTSALTVLFQTLNHLIPEVKKPLFSKRNSVCGELVFEFLRLSNSRLRKVRDLAATSFYVLLENNFIQTQNIARVKLQTTIAITRMVGKEPTDFNRLLTSFEPIVRNAKNGLSRNDIYGEPIPKQVEVLQAKINSIIEQSKKMSQYQYDPEMMADLYYKISKEFMESPDERITWLESLAETHRANKHLEECAQTKIVTAALVQAYLSLLGRWEVNTPTAFHLVCPNIDREIEIPSPGTLESLKDEICQSKLFSEEGFVGLLHDAIKSLREGGLYEQCVTAYRMMLPIFQEQEDYERQMNCHLDLFNLCKLLIDENTMNQRIFSNYYRVAFYGKPFKDMDGKEYIYKELNTNRVAEVAENLKVRYERKFGKVVMLPNKDVKPEELDPNVCHIQLGAVEIMPPEFESVTPVKSLYKQYFNINRFVMEQPFTKGGKAQGEIEDQFIRRTIFTTECSFPYVKKRVPVQAKETKELSPIESAAMLIEKKIRSLKTELDSATPNTKILQRELQGSLLTQVNAGPLAIAQIFLSDASADKFSAQHRAHLAELLMEFERLLGFGVRLNKSLIHDDMIPLQEGLENGYQVFRNELEKHKIFGEQRELKSKQREQKQMEEAARARQTMGQIEEELQSRRRSKSGASSMQPKKKVDTPLQRIAVSSTVTAPKTSTSPVVTKPVVEKKPLPTTPPAPNTPPNAEPKRDRAATTAPTRTTSSVVAQGPDSRKSMALNMNNVTNGEKSDPAKSPTPVSPSAKKASLGSSSASNKTNTTPTTSPSGVKAAAAKLNNNNAKEDEAAAKLTGFHTKITQIVVDIQTDLNALSLKILAALTPEEAGGCIPYVKTIKAEVEKMRASVKINTTANVTVTPRGNNEDKLNYVVDVLSREIENLRKQFAEIKENVVKVDDATKLMNLAQSLKVVKTEITMAAK